MNSFQQGLSALVAQHAGSLPNDALMRAAESLVNGPEMIEVKLRFQSGVAVPESGRFTDLGDSVRDLEPNLTWTKKTLDVGKVDFKGAEKATAALSISGGGWRLPTIRELLTIVDYERHDPAINPIFEAKSDWYWTSSPAADSPAGCAWIVYFGSGAAGWLTRDGRAFVRAVRPSQ